MNINQIYNFVKITLASFVLIIVLNSCEQEIEIELPEQIEQLVIFGMLNNSITPYVTMSKSISIYDYRYQNLNNIKPIDSAKIKIYNLTDTLIMESPTINEEGLAVFFFPNTFNFVAGETYNLEAEADGLKVTARTTIPEMITVANYEFKRDTINELDGYKYIDSYVEFEVEDLNNLEGGVQVANNLKYYEYFYKFDTLTGQTTEEIDSIFIDNNSFELFYDNRIENISNNKLSKDVRLPYYLESLDPFFTNITFNLSMRITNFNKDLVTYFKSVNDQRNTLDNPFAEPSFINGNIEGGLGVFGASNSTNPIEIEFICCE